MAIKPTVVGRISEDAEEDGAGARHTHTQSLSYNQEQIGTRIYNKVTYETDCLVCSANQINALCYVLCYLRNSCRRSFISGICCSTTLLHCASRRKLTAARKEESV
eukprot:1405349-Amphidinium_carterae.1